MSDFATKLKLHVLKSLHDEMQNRMKTKLGEHLKPKAVSIEQVSIEPKSEALKEGLPEGMPEGLHEKPAEPKVPGLPDEDAEELMKHYLSLK